LVEIDDLGNITTPGEVDGRDVSADGSSLDSHLGNTSNPHSVTADQVGKDTAQWNADRLRSRNVLDQAPLDNDVLTWNQTSNRWEPAPPPGAAAGEANTASNVGTAGVGVFKTKVGVDLRFKKINAGSSKVSVTDDVANDEVDIDVVPGQINHDDINGTGFNTHGQIDSHIGSAANPHSVTAAQTGAVPTTEKGAPNGVATLDGSGDVPDAQIPDSITRDLELNAHATNTSNPHSVTASQVGNTTAQWNANQIQDRNVLNSSPADGNVLTWVNSNNRWEPQPASAQSAPAMTEVASTVTDTTASASDTLLAGMTVTPVAGTYRVDFSASVDHSSTGASVWFSVYLDGVQVAASERFFRRGGAQGDVTNVVHCMAKVTVNGAQIIEIRWRTDASLAASYRRQMMVQAVS
jgi:hypothetical protein